jgi:hypothetical protein
LLAAALCCRSGPSLLRAPPPVVEALLQGMPGSGSAASQLDALQSQLEEGNAVLLHEAAPVLELLSADALSADPAQVGSKALIQRRFSTFPSHLACGGAGFENCLLACVLKCSCPPFVPFVLFFFLFFPAPHLAPTLCSSL